MKFSFSVQILPLNQDVRLIPAVLCDSEWRLCPCSFSWLGGRGGSVCSAGCAERWCTRNINKHRRLRRHTALSVPPFFLTLTDGDAPTSHIQQAGRNGGQNVRTQWAWCSATQVLMWPTSVWVVCVVTRWVGCVWQIDSSEVESHVGLTGCELFLGFWCITQWLKLNLAKDKQCSVATL